MYECPQTFKINNTVNLHDPLATTRIAAILIYRVAAQINKKWLIRENWIVNKIWTHMHIIKYLKFEKLKGNLYNKSPAYNFIKVEQVHRGGFMKWVGSNNT